MANRLLNPQQARALRCVLDGHNTFISGQAGTGKSFLVCEIVKSVQRSGRRVAVLCSSGIACTVYSASGFNANTVHSYYGMQTADLPWRLVVDRATSNVQRCKEIGAVDVLIFDEVSMTSRRIFEIVNRIHHELCPDDNRPFAGKQVVLVGEFLQLRPVPNILDDGSYLFESPLFQFAFLHRVQLTTLMRQDDANMLFMTALSELRQGNCSDDTERYLRSLDRNLPNDETNAVHIYFRKRAVCLHNLAELDKLTGTDMQTFHADETGSGSTINCPADSILRLKPGCKVMLLWNKTATLKNGSTGIYCGMKEQCLEVDFCDVGKVLLKRETWYKRDRTGNIVGSRKQFPLALCYAVTCHKVQGLNLSLAVVHCSREFVPGMIYVSLSRVKNERAIRVVGFRKSHLLKPSEVALHICHVGTVDEISSLECCSGKILKAHDVHDYSNAKEEDEDSLNEDILKYTEIEDNVLASYFEVAEDELTTDLLNVFLTMNSKESGLAQLPGYLKGESILENLKCTSPKMSTFAQEKNAIISELSCTSVQEECLVLFLKVAWLHAFGLVEKYIIENFEDVVIIRRQFTEVTGHLYQYLASDDLRLELCILFNTKSLSSAQKALGAQIVINVFKEFVHCLSVKCHTQRDEEPIDIDVSSMSSEGLSKVRHVGGWAVHQVITVARKYVKTNMYSLNKSTRAKVQENHCVCELLEEHVIIPFSTLERESKYKHTLQVTEARQYRERGLLHISDDVFKFFLQLEQMRVNKINESKLGQAKANLVQEALTSTLEDQNLQNMWASCFDTSSDSEVTSAIYKNIVKSYVNMGAAQFLRDYRRCHQLKKSAEHRKRVLQRKTILEEKRDKVPMKQFLDDKREGKMLAHNLMVSFINKHSIAGLKRAYCKDELLRLCSAYGIQIHANTTKIELSKKLANKVLSSHSVPVSCYLMDLHVHNMNHTNGRVVMTLKY